jgi:tetratricopeptide (TPR) repeat protein
MRRSPFISLGLAAFFMTAVPGGAQAAVDDLVRHALELEAGGRAGEAYALLAPLAAIRAGDPDFDYALGIAAADGGHAAEAIIALQRVLALQPRNAQARAELARVYAMSGDVDTAKREFDTVVDDPSLPDPVRQRFNRIVRDLGREQKGGGNALTGYLEESVGADTNINTATSLTSVVLPIFASLGPANLSGGASRMDANFYTVDAGLSYASALSRQTRGFISVLGSLRDNLGSRQFDQSVLTATAGVGHTLASRDVLSASAQYQQFWLARGRYRQAYGPTAQYTHRLAGGRALSFAAQWLRLDYRTDPLRDADRLMLSATYAGRYTYAALSGGHEETRDGSADNLSNSFYSARTGIELPIQARAAFVGAVAIERRTYDAADPLFLKSRRDTQVDVSGGVKLLLVRNVYLRPSLSYTRNYSNISLFAYSRFIASFGLRVEF